MEGSGNISPGKVSGILSQLFSSLAELIFRMSEAIDPFIFYVLKVCKWTAFPLLCFSLLYVIETKNSVVSVCSAALYTYFKIPSLISVSSVIITICIGCTCLHTVLPFSVIRWFYKKK